MFHVQSVTVPVGNSSDGKHEPIKSYGGKKLDSFYFRITKQNWGNPKKHIVYLAVAMHIRAYKVQNPTAPNHW